MLINLRNALMAGKKLPYDAEVEYLESTGTQWIDTGINAKQSLRIRAVFETNSTTSQFAYGVRVGDSTISCSTGVGTSVGLARWGTSAYADAGPSGLVDITQDSSGVIVNGTSHRYNATQTVVEQSGYTMVVFAGRNSTTTVTANMVGKFYSCKIWENGVLVRDLIPVRKGTVGYLYDRVSGKLFGNAGTGDFVVGQDVVPVEYIESHGTEWINTGIFASACDEVELSFAVRTTNFRNYIFGCSSNTYGYVEVSASNMLKTEAASTYNISPLTLYKATFKKSDFSVLVNGTTLDITCGTSSVSIFLRDANFAISCTAPDGRYCGKMLIYGVKLSSDSQTLRNFKPVRVGTGSSWEGAMMDVLTRRIYRNAGTGAFGYGNDLKYPIPAE